VSALLRAELLKLRSTRTALGMGIAAALVTVLPAILLIAFLPKGTIGGDEARTILTAGSSLVTYILLVFGILGMTGEYRHGTITYTYLATPRRGRVMVVKLVVYAVVGCLVMLIALLLANLIGALGLPLRGVSYPAPDGAALADYARQIVTAGLITAFGVALGALFRAQVVTVAGTLIWALMVEPLIVVFKPHIGTWLPFNVFSQVIATPLGGEPGTAGDLSRPAAFLLSIAYIAAVSVLAVFISMRRDVT
jgi:ABC-type transport system involved in multi-copper enzyme maturation permease subunit